MPENPPSRALGSAGSMHVGVVKSTFLSLGVFDLHSMVGRPVRRPAASGRRWMLHHLYYIKTLPAHHPDWPSTCRCVSKISFLSTRCARNIAWQPFFGRFSHTHTHTHTRTHTHTQAEGENDDFHGPLLLLLLMDHHTTIYRSAESGHISI